MPRIFIQAIRIKKEAELSRDKNSRVEMGGGGDVFVNVLVDISLI
jgi:hypothetical protein